LAEDDAGSTACLAANPAAKKRSKGEQTTLLRSMHWVDNHDSVMSAGFAAMQTCAHDVHTAVRPCQREHDSCEAS
jgi:hypothetical protein